MPDPIPVLEIGGTHVTAAVVTPGTWQVAGSSRAPLDSNGSAEQIVGAFVAAGDRLDVPAGLAWSVAMPDPFDYARGIATFRDVGKFDAIYGMDIRAALRSRLRTSPAQVLFLNDADAFILGEWTRGGAAGYRRCIGITLGTGIGSGWLIDGRITSTAPGVPALGRARNLRVYGAGLEEVVSSRGIGRDYALRTRGVRRDVRQITELARSGDAGAVATLRRTFTGLGLALGPAAQEFGADVIVVGGSMAKSWDLYEPWFREGLAWQAAPPVAVSLDPERAALLGAARFALSPPAGAA